MHSNFVLWCHLSPLPSRYPVDKTFERPRIVLMGCMEFVLNGLFRMMVQATGNHRLVSSFISMFLWYHTSDGTKAIVFSSEQTQNEAVIKKTLNSGI